MKIYHVFEPGPYAPRHDYKCTLFAMVKPLDLTEVELNQISSLAIGESVTIENNFTITREPDAAEAPSNVN